MNGPTDADLLLAVREGDREAMETLLVRHAPAVLRFARSMCDDPIEADDVAQETLITAARAVGELRADAALSSWLYAVTRSYCTKARRRKKGAPTRTVPVLEALDAASERQGPEEEAAGKELAAALDLAIHRLDPKMREVVLLRDVEGLTAPEVAAVLDLQVATVKTRLHRGRVELRNRLTPVLSASAERQPSCPEVVARFSRFLEGEVGPDECALMHAHVESCPACNAACASLRRSLSLCHEAGASPTPDVLTKVRFALSVVIAPNP